MTSNSLYPRPVTNSLTLTDKIFDEIQNIVKNESNTKTINRLTVLISGTEHISANTLYQILATIYDRPGLNFSWIPPPRKTPCINVGTTLNPMCYVNVDIRTGTIHSKEPLVPTPSPMSEFHSLDEEFARSAAHHDLIGLTEIDWSAIKYTPGLIPHYLEAGDLRQQMKGCIRLYFFVDTNYKDVVDFIHNVLYLGSIGASARLNFFNQDNSMSMKIIILDIDISAVERTLNKLLNSRVENKEVNLINNLLPSIPNLHLFNVYTRLHELRYTDMELGTKLTLGIGASVFLPDNIVFNRLKLENIIIPTMIRPEKNKLLDMNLLLI